MFDEHPKSKPLGSLNESLSLVYNNQDVDNKLKFLKTLIGNRV